MSTLMILGLWRHSRVREATAEVRPSATGGYEVQFSPDDIQQCRSRETVQNLMMREAFRHSADLDGSIEAAMRMETTILAPAEILQITTPPARTLSDLIRQLDFGPQEFA